jgi:hypothetical protein
MPSVFDLLDDIEKWPTMFVGWSPDERDKQLFGRDAARWAAWHMFWELVHDFRREVRE